MSPLSTLAKQWLPPALMPVLRRARERVRGTKRYGLRGRYETWAAALSASSGYASPVIVERVAHAVQQVLDGKAACERDSMAFTSPLRPWPLLAALARQAAADDGRLRVLDFGGSFGSTYFVARDFLAPLRELRWHVVEQPLYVARAASMRLPPDLRLFATVAAAAEGFMPNVVLASGVLHYLEQPFEVLASLAELGAATLIVDRTPCIDELHDVITVQHVPPELFDASYPSWLFHPSRVPGALQRQYPVVDEFLTDDVLSFEGRLVEHRGWVLRR